MRLSQIDFLRGMAVILVLFRHFKIVPVLYSIGWMGVDLFFVLSGYLVSGLLFKEYQKFGSIKPGLFLIRRGFKIYPLFYLAIGMTVVINYLFKGSINWSQVVPELIFVQNYFKGLWNHTWSLGVEEHFYFLLTFIFFILSVRKKLLHFNTVLGLVALTILTCLSFRIYNNYSAPFNYYTHLFNSHIRIDGLMFGVFISFLHNTQKETFNRIVEGRRTILYCISALLISPVFFFPVSNTYMNTIGLSSLYFGFGILIAAFVSDEKINEKMARILSRPGYMAISKIGFYSYSIYLFHMFIERYLLTFMEKAGFDFGLVINFTIYFVMSIVTGIVLSTVVEIPFLNMRDKYFPKRPG